VFGNHRGNVDLTSIGGRGFEVPAAVQVAPAGDANGDGRDDLALIATVGDAGVAAYVVFGKRDLVSPDLQDLGPDGREIMLPAAGDVQEGPEDGITGLGARAAGDFNDDGFGDLIVGDPLADGGAGRAWVVFGSADSVTPLSLDALGSDGIEISGQGDGYLGGSVSGAGDVNGDGIDDVIVGVPYRARPREEHGSGAAIVIYGSDEPTDVDIANLGTGGLILSNGDRAAQLGAVVAGIGDANGDGLADVLVTAPRTSAPGREAAGSAYVVFGSRAEEPSLAVDELGSRGYEIAGATGDGTGQGQFPGGVGSSAAAAGDVNDDGFADVALGSPGAAEAAAAAYVVFGDNDGSPVDLAKPGGRAFAIDAPRTPLSGPLPVAGNADFDGDGRADLLFAPLHPGSGPTAAYVVSGKP
jgi:hypothetical protein